MRFGSVGECAERSYTSNECDKDCFYELAAGLGGLIIFQGLNDGMPMSFVLGGIMMTPAAIKYGYALSVGVVGAVRGCKNIPKSYRIMRAGKERTERAEMRAARTDDSSLVKACTA